MSFDYKFTLPWPPTNNRYYRRVGNKTIISADGRKYAKSVRDAMLIGGMVNEGIESPISMTLTYLEPDRRRRDIDGLQKALFDSLTKCGFWHDDSQIRRVSMEMIAKDEHIVGGGAVEVSVKKINKS